MRLLQPIVFVAAAFFTFGCAFADEVPAEHQEHCRTWENGKCTSGALTDFAKTVLFSLDVEEQVDPDSGDSVEQAPDEEAPGEVIEENACEDACEACENCSKCRYCNMCSWYNGSECKGLFYYNNAEECAEIKTESCCDLCEIACTREGNYCGKGGICGDGTDSISVTCQEAQGNTCTACDLVE